MTYATVAAMLGVTLIVAADQNPDAGPIRAGTASVTGRVTEGESRRPLDQVIVRLVSADRSGVLTTLTDGDGRYLFENIAGGDYEVAAQREGFVTAHYGESDAASPTAHAVRVASGETRKLIDLRMIRGGAISGRVINRQGGALKDVPVVAQAIVGPADFRIAGENGVRHTNGDGAYTINDLPPGNYLISVTWQSREMFAAGAATDWRPVYYPGTDRRQEALSVPVVAAETTRNINVTVVVPERFRLSGHILRGSAEGPIEANVVSNGNFIRAITLDAEGRFDVPQLKPGVYTLWARCCGNAPSEAAVLTLDLDSDVTDVNVPLLSTGRLTGRVVTADGAPLPPGQLYIAAMLAAGGQEVDPLPRDRVEVAGDGSFELTGVVGERLLRVTGLRPTWQVDRILHGRIPVEVLTIQPGSELHDVTVVLINR